MVELLEMLDKVSLLLDVTERADMLIEEITQDFLVPLESAGKKNEYVKIRMMSQGDAYHARLKGEILGNLIDDITVGLQEITKAIQSTTTEQEPARKTLETFEDYKNHQDMSKTERVDEILNQIGVFAGMIENFPDWLDRMKTLNFVATCLAMGCNGYNFTCKEPGQD